MDVLLEREEVSEKEEERNVGSRLQWRRKKGGMKGRLAPEPHAVATATATLAQNCVLQLGRLWGTPGWLRLVDMLLDTPELQVMSTADLVKAQRKLLALSGEIAALLERKTDGARGG